MARDTAANYPWIEREGGPAVGRPCAARWARMALLLVASGLAGCSGRGTYITGGPSTGQLKSSLSHLEFENDQLKTQVARLKEENRQFEDKLVQERLHSDVLVTKLDNARNLLRDQGYDSGSDPDLDAPLSRSRTLPAGRTTPPKRKSPAAQISRASDLDEIPPIRIDDGSRPRSSTRPAGSRPASSRTSEDETLGLNTEDLRWVPIARGEDATASPKR
ncbi:cell division protein ZapB [Paludisphaera soli]|uniref:cell division protein ZapB n=1 Tax=Paludisphaera soli TaxID=2712865 RepID=UPI0013EB4BDF|nr:cell division protein ZapB [Paludisphaera soli]